MKLKGWIWVSLVLMLSAFSAWRVYRGQAIQTDLLAMLPDTEKNPVAEQAIRNLAQSAGERAVFLVGGKDSTEAKQAALCLAENLDRSGAFSYVLGRIPPVDPSMVARFYAPYRYRLSAPGREMAESEEALAAQIQARLASPQGSFGGLGPGLDPLGRMDDFLASLPLNSTHFELSDDLLVVRDGERLFVLITATLKGSSFDPEIQTQSLTAIRSASKLVASAHPGAKLLRTGPVFYAEEARTAAEREMNLISLASMGCIFLLYLLVFRTLRQMLLGLACVASGVACATALCLLLFGRLYLLTLVCGASVLGVAVDYSFLYFAHHLGSGSDWEPNSALRRIFPALLMGFLTTVLGYAALMVAPFPGMRQIAAFSILGLLGAFLAVLLVLPDWLREPVKKASRLSIGLDVGLNRLRALAERPSTVPALLVCVALLIAGAWRLKVDDAANGLIQTSKILKAEEDRIRTLTGLSSNGTFFLVEGRDEGQVLEREEALRTRLDGHVRSGDLDSYHAVSSFVPSPRSQSEELARQRACAPKLQVALKQLGFRPEALQQQKADLAASEACPLTVETWLREPFSMPYRMLWMGRTSSGCASVILPLGLAEGERMRQAAAGLPGVQFVDKAASVGKLLGRYRILASWALLGACFLVWGLLGTRYGARAAFWVLIPAVLGILLALAGTALLGFPLTLFGVMALILTLGFGVDYTVFLREGRHRRFSASLGVLLAAGATLISYGFLAFSQTPILRGFGLALSFGVLGSALTAFLALRGSGEQP